MSKKILLADDSLTIQRVAELTFADSGYELVCVSNGQQALERIAGERPDLILADVVMPEKNGYEICEAVKSNPATARIPVVLLSGIFEPFDRERAARIGCDATISKPFDSQNLLAEVEKLFARPTATPAPGPAPARPAPVEGATSHPAAFSELTDEQIERIARRVVEMLSEKVLREIAWEVVPEKAENLIKRRIEELESGIE